MKSTVLIFCTCILGAPLAARSQSLPQTGGLAFSADIGLSAYRYTEPDVMKLNGTKRVAQVGVDAPLSAGYRLGAELRYADGDVDYRSVARLGSVRADGLRDYLVDTRALLSRDLQVGGARVRPFAGLGYRYVYNDARGVRSATVDAERRNNRLLYLPIGVVLPLGEQLALRVELDPVLRGKHKSRQSDINASWSDVDLDQRYGLGAKLQLTYTVNRLRLLPYVDLWRVGASDAGPLLLQDGRRLSSGGRALAVVEPKNHTIEAGMMLGYAF